jgi:hypothetical protein
MWCSASGCIRPRLAGVGPAAVRADRGCCDNGSSSGPATLARRAVRGQRHALDRARSGRHHDPVRFPWQPAEYARTCTQCGYTWRVPRWAARRRVGAISPWRVAPRGVTVDRAELASEVQAIEAQNQQADTYRVCPHCGAETFKQQPARAKPADLSPPRT